MESEINLKSPFLEKVAVVFFQTGFDFDDVDIFF